VICGGGSTEEDEEEGVAEGRKGWKERRTEAWKETVMEGRRYGGKEVKDGKIGTEVKEIETEGSEGRKEGRNERKERRKKGGNF
jgi:hypothetical protein